ncbi:MAG TPA: ComF family protein [Nitrospiria bacterium]|nr:ComF family protein [Nitrospiria bacterium]
MKIYSSLLNSVFPNSCLICRSTIKKDIGDRVCLDCWKKVRFSDGPLCPVCGKPFLSGSTLLKSPDYRCGICRKSRPHFTKHIYLGPYEGILSDIIRLFKFKKKAALAYPLSYLLCRKIKDIPEIDIIIPVPLHPRRLRFREFNQSLLLSRLISNHINRPVLKDVIVKNKDTLPQVRLDGDKRRINMKNVFSITEDYLVNKKRVLLIDDVFTTGSTVNECSKILKKSGAYSIYVLTLVMANN